MWNPLVLQHYRQIDSHLIAQVMLTNVKQDINISIASIQSIIDRSFHHNRWMIEKCRKRSTCLYNEMDAREGHSQNKCGMCDQKSHNRKMVRMDNICELVKTLGRSTRWDDWQMLLELYFQFKFNKMLCDFLLRLIMHLMIYVLIFNYVVFSV